MLVTWAKPQNALMRDEKEIMKSEMLSHRSQSVLGPKSSAAFAELIALPGALVNGVWTNTVQQVSIF